MFFFSPVNSFRRKAILLQRAYDAKTFLTSGERERTKGGQWLSPSQFLQIADRQQFELRFPSILLHAFRSGILPGLFIATLSVPHTRCALHSWQNLCHFHRWRGGVFFFLTTVGWEGESFQDLSFRDVNRRRNTWQVFVRQVFFFNSKHVNMLRDLDWHE